MMHGTYGGLQKHRKTGVPACGPCRAAGKAYIRAWRQRDACVRGLGWPAAPEGWWDPGVAPARVTGREMP